MLICDILHTSCVVVTSLLMGISLCPPDSLPLGAFGAIHLLSVRVGGLTHIMPDELRCFLHVQKSMEQRISPKTRVSQRIGGALDLMKRTFREGTHIRASLHGGPAGLDLGRNNIPERRQRALGARNSMLPEIEGDDDEERDEDDADEGDEELDDELDDEGDVGDVDEEYDPIAPRGPLENNNYGEIWLPVQARPRRNRKNHAIRRLVQESVVKPSSLIYPLFVHDEVGD